MKKHLVLSALIGFLSFSSFLWGEQKAVSIEEEIYQLYSKDQLVDGLILVFEKREPNFMNQIFLKALKKYNSEAYKKAFIEKMNKHFSKEDLPSLKNYYLNRIKPQAEIESSKLKDNFFEFNADLQLLLAEVKDDNEEKSMGEKILDVDKKIKHARYKSCSANMIVLIGAIEVYNLDHTPGITSLKPEDYQKGGVLVFSKLIQPLRLPEKGCEYFLYRAATASDPADVRCKIHGERVTNFSNDDD